ncbi:MAG TPA: type II and III secretion system protein family protein [Pyrinomonadaceae bacterium]|nr:type II and III secretion system protein family protein [Pyrinomonadaceae bacterium]
MQSRSPIPRRLSLVLASLVTIFATTIIHAQENSYKASFAQNKEAIAVNVLVGQSRVINFDRAVGRFSVSNPDIAEAVLVTPDQVLVNGKQFGQVNFIAWEQSGGEFLVFDVYVRANLSLIDSQIRALFPKDDIRLSQANGSVVISGSVTAASTAAQVQSVVEAAGFKTVNMLTSPAKGISQVQLQVRVAEVSRNRIKDIGTSYTYQGAPSHGGYLNSGAGPSGLSDPIAQPRPLCTMCGIVGGPLTPALNLLMMGGNSLAMLRLLQTQGAIRELAEPNIIAMDGQEASFLAGGEFPIPVVQTDGARVGISIVFKEYGVRLNFKPTIIDEDHIRLELTPEVSTIDFNTGVKFDGFLIPGLQTRRAKTGVELRDGQSFALAGLLDNRETKSISEVPVLSQIPILGNLFKSKSFQKNETELMFIVTAQIVKPVNRDELPQMRGIDGLKNGSPLGLEPKGEGITGRTGFSNGQTPEATPATAPPAPKAEEPKKDNNSNSGAKSTSGSTASTRVINPSLPVARVVAIAAPDQPLVP